jgi:hypothetical protein
MPDSVSTSRKVLNPRRVREALAAVHARNSQRYGTPASVVRDFHLGRNLVFKLLRDRLVRSISIKAPGQGPALKGAPKKAIRLIDLDSLEDWLAKNAIEKLK